MPQIYYLPEERTVEVAPDETILSASLRAGVKHAHACGGNARCSTCRVLILDDPAKCAPRNERELSLAERLHFTPELRLACQTTLKDDVRLRKLALDDADIELISRLCESGEPMPVGEEKEIAILFADIRGFTAVAEALPPYDVIYLLNRYFSQMDQVITRRGGYIDNYIGDGIMALFGVDGQPDAALRATAAGLDMLAAVERMKPYLEAAYDRTFNIGVGIHYGEAVVGGIGPGETHRVTAIGDAVNFASRIEAANKALGTKLLLSEETYRVVAPRVQLGRQCANVVIPGKRGAHTLYEVVGLND
ncbi:MAG TPA: adenylate/guanylate cyclase domain-containing protein [Pyrinomonadaceae bacterium]|jgi:adenylate cyclase